MKKTIAALSLTTLMPFLPAAGNDQEETAPTAWRLRTDQSVTDIQSESAAGYRPVDVEIRTTSPLRFDVAYVKNTGAHKKTWTLSIGKTFGEVTGLVTNSNRILRLTPYVTGGAVRFCALFVSRTDSDDKAWWWYANTSLATILAEASNKGARPIDIDSYVVGNTRYYSAVLIRNTGADARAWWLYLNQTTADIAGKTAQHGARVFDIERRSSDRYDVVLTRPTSLVSSWYYTGRTMSDIDALTKQNGALVFDVETYVENNQRRYAVLMIQNTNELTTRIGKILRTGTDGATGVLLKQIGGSTLASLQPDFVFDPASTLKQLHGVYAIRKVRTDPAVSLTTPMTFFTGPCPYDTNPVTEPLATLVRTMLENSDNPRTVAIERRWGKTAIHAMADSLGMTETRSNRLMGCSAPPYNTTTLNDLRRLHEAVAGGYLGSFRETFIDLMRNDQPTFPRFGSQRLSTVLAQERAKAGLSADEYAAFLARFRMAYKPGSKTILGKRHQTISGWMSVPFVVGKVVQPREYMHGVFAHGASNSTSAADTVALAATELLREVIGAAMQTWKGVVFGSFTKFGSSCAAYGNTPSHDATGSPVLGRYAIYRLTLAPANRPAVMILGGSNSKWGRTGLPLSLAAIGAPGCFLRASYDAGIATSTSDSGAALLALDLQGTPALIGAHVYTQFAVLAPRVNSLGVVTTNGVDTRIGTID